MTVLDLLRFGHARTRPELAHHSGLGRAVVNQQLGLLSELGLVREGDLAPSDRGPGAAYVGLPVRSGDAPGGASSGPPAWWPG